MLCTSRLAARLPARIAALGKTCRVFNTVALFHFLFYVHDGFPNSKVRALADLCAHSTPPPPPRLLVADAEETVTGACFFYPLRLSPFCPRPFQVKGAERPHRRPRQNLSCLQYSGLISFFILRTRLILKQ